MLETFSPPLPVRVFNQSGHLFRKLGVELIALEPEALRRWAVAETGLSDFGREGHEEALEVLCRSLEEDAQLSMVGRISLRQVLRRSLVNRLRRVEATRCRPQIFAAPLKRPLIVIGLPRSGTTFLHRLLCLAPEARPLRTFELQSPFAPTSGRDKRVQESRSDLKKIKSIARALDAKHFMGAEEPEECMWLLNSSLVSATFWVFAPVYAYLDWYLEQDHGPAYQAYREHLQLFQAESPDLRLTLKAPIHTGHLDALLEAVPEAMVVQTHRDPKPVMGSANSLFFTIHSVMSEGVDVARMGRKNLEMLSRMMGQHLEARERWDDRILDVHYDDLISDPLSTLKRVHDHYELGWDDALEARVTTHLGERKQHRFGKHTYSLEECGLSSAEVDEAFAPYRARFLNGQS